MRITASNHAFRMVDLTTAQCTDQGRFKLRPIEGQDGEG
jgi:hypothetical protein